MVLYIWKVFIGALADPHKTDFEPVLLCLDLDPFELWMSTNQEPEYSGWSRCTWFDFFNQAGRPDSADQVSAFVDNNAFGDGITKFLTYATQLNDDSRDRLFYIQPSEGFHLIYFIILLFYYFIIFIILLS